MKKAAFILVFCCLLWGYSFPVLQLAMKALRDLYYDGRPSTTLQDLGLIGAFLGWRCGLASLIMLLFFPSTWRGYSRDDLRIGASLGVVFMGGLLCQLFGLQYTLPSVSSFLTSLTVILAPLAQALIFRRPVGRVIWLGVALSLAGAAVLAQPNSGACAECTVTEEPPVRYLGEILTILGTIFFTMQLLILDRFSARCNSQRMTLISFVMLALIASVIGWVFCGKQVYRAEVIGEFAKNTRMMLLLLLLTVFSSVVAFNLMNRYQRDVSPAAASVIYTTESVFATIFSLLFGTERLTGTTVLGGVLLMGAFAVVTLPGTQNAAKSEI